MSMTDTPVDNGVNVAALLEAREALTAAPEAAQFQWRASCTWKNGTHSHSTVEGFFGLGAEQHHKREFTLRRRSPGDLRLRGQRGDTRRVRARRPGELPHRRRRRRRPEPGDPAALGLGDPRRRDGRRRHPRHRQRRAQRVQRHQGDLRHRRRRHAPTRSRRSSPSRRSGRRCTTSSPTRRTSPSRFAEPSRPAEGRPWHATSRRSSSAPAMPVWR